MFCIIACDRPAMQPAGAMLYIGACGYCHFLQESLLTSCSINYLPEKLHKCYLNFPCHNLLTHHSIAYVKTYLISVSTKIQISMEFKNSDKSALIHLCSSVSLCKCCSLPTL